MAVTERMEDGVLTLDVSGRLNAVTALELHDKMMELMPKAEKLIFDFTNLDYISSGGLRELLIAYEAMNPKGGVIIRNINPEVQSVLAMTGFSSIFTIE